MKEFMYVFQISKLITFEVNYYTLGTNSAPYFSTSANEFCRNKLDYTRGGQAQRDLLPKFSPARRFFEKWDHCHLHDLTPAEYEEIAADIEELKTRYNYIEDIRDTFRGSRSSIPFYEVVKLSKMEPKKRKPQLIRESAGNYYIELTGSGVRGSHGFETLHFYNISRGLWGACFGHGMTDHTAPTLSDLRSYYGL